MSAYLSFENNIRGEKPPPDCSELSIDGSRPRQRVETWETIRVTFFDVLELPPKTSGDISRVEKGQPLGFGRRVEGARKSVSVCFVFLLFL